MNLSPLPIQKFFDNDGKPLVGGKLFTYAAGTTTKLVTYSNSTGTNNTNPIILNFRGEAAVWLDPTLSYKFVLAPSTDTDPPTNPIWTVDNITAAPANMDNAALDTGSINAIQLSYPSLPSTPAIFTRIVWKSATQNSSAVTISINGGPVKALNWQNGQALSAGALQTNGMYEAIYDGTAWQLQGPTLSPGEMLTVDEFVLGIVPADYSIPSYLELGFVNPFRYFSATQAAAVRAYSYTQDVTAALQDAMDLAWTVQVPLYLPGGGYQVTGLALPGQAARRDRSFIMRGAGAGEIFATLNTGSTIIRSTTNANVLQYTPDAANTGNGQTDISYIEWRQDNAAATAAVIRFGSFYDKSRFYGCNVYQGGVGNGIECELANTSEFDHNYIISFAWNTLGLGAARVGIALKITNTIDTGLTKADSNTYRGFKQCLVVGGGAGTHYKDIFTRSECSVFYDGVVLNSNVQCATVRDFYMEGAEGGVGVNVLGNYNIIEDNLMFPGFGTGIDDSTTTTYGTVCKGNLISAGSVANSKCAKVGGSAKLKTFSDNTLVFGGSGGAIAGVVGLTLSGASPAFDLSGNSFDPAVAWTGGAGTSLLADTTTGTGMKGFIFYNSAAASTQGPKLSRGVVTLTLGPTLTETSVVANVLTFGEENCQTLNFGAARTINSIVTPNDGAKIVTIISLNNNATFANTASLQVIGGANFTPGAAGGCITVKMQGAVCQDIGHGSY